MWTSDLCASGCSVRGLWWRGVLVWTRVYCMGPWPHRLRPSRAARRSRGQEDHGKGKGIGIGERSNGVDLYRNQRDNKSRRERCPSGFLRDEKEMIRRVWIT